MGEIGDGGMKEKVKTRQEVLVEIADLRKRLEAAEQLLQKVDNNRIGRELAEEALKKAKNGQKKAEDSLEQSETRIKNLTSQLLLAEEKERGRGQMTLSLSFNQKSAISHS